METPNYGEGGAYYALKKALFELTLRFEWSGCHCLEVGVCWNPALCWFLS